MNALWWAYGGCAALIGLCIGSFANVCIDRLPHDRNLLDRSACPVCGHAIRSKDLIPVVSFVTLHGKCRDCGAPIPPVTPWIEVLGGLLAALAYRKFIPDAGSLDLAHGAAWTLYFGFLAALMIATLTDIRHRIILDQTSIYAAPIGILGVAAAQALGYDGWPHLTWKNAVLGASANGVFLGGIALVLQWVLRRDGLGWGDVKLLVMIGAFLGLTFWPLMFASVLGASAGILLVLRRSKSEYLPFGPSLALGAALYVLYGDLFLARFFPGMEQLNQSLGLP